MSNHGKRADGKTTITFALDESLKELLRRQAERERRSLSNYVAKALEEIAAVEEERISVVPAPPKNHRDL